LSLLDQCASATTGELTVDRVYSCLGIAGVQDCAQLLSAIAHKDAKTALSLVNRSYAEGKDLRALLDELACVLRDLMVLKTAPREGISLLSGVATETDLKPIANLLSNGELVYMMNSVQETLHGFTSTGTRRMDAELCVLNLCQPELLLEAESINARLCRVEDQLKSGNIRVQTSILEPAEDEMPPAPDDWDAPPLPEEENSSIQSELPVGFWTDLSADLRLDLPISVRGFFQISQNPQVTGVLNQDILEVRCDSAFTAQMLDKPEIVSIISQKASARLGKQIRIVITDITSKPSMNRNMSQLLDFGRAHADIVRIKDKNQ
jgi:DNA polymerase-3 subunit gamma/tau